MSSSQTSTSSTSPIPLTRLSELTNEICTTVFPPTTKTYTHALTSSQNTTIINTLLQKLIAESTTTAAGPPGYKFLVTSTIIQQQQQTPTMMAGGEEQERGEESKGERERGLVGEKRGMHSASGAYWNNERDGMWSCKWEGAEGRGFDVVVSVVWISVV